MTEHYFSTDHGPEPAEKRLLRIDVRGRDLQMWVSDRVFSTTRLDPGTKELLKVLPSPPEQGTFLDLGCGWGPVAVSLALERPEASVWAVDVNQRALTLTLQNAETNGAPNVRVMDAAQALEEARSTGKRFDLIVSNPPVRIGKSAMHDMLSAWLELLRSGGEAWLVIGKNLGGDSLLKWLISEGFAAEKVASRKGYRIIRVAADPRPLVQ